MDHSAPEWGQECYEDQEDLEEEGAECGDTDMGLECRIDRQCRHHQNYVDRQCHHHRN
ncbi:unnamed protein product, partial [Cylicocyclus nassatus]